MPPETPGPTDGPPEAEESKILSLANDLGQLSITTDTNDTGPLRMNSKHACFFDIPAELRNHIYAVSLISGGPRCDFLPEPGLLRMSKAIRNEALAMFLRNNTFIYDAGSASMLQCLVRKLERMSLEQRSLLSRITISTYPSAAKEGEFLYWYAMIFRLCPDLRGAVIHLQHSDRTAWHDVLYTELEVLGRDQSVLPEWDLKALKRRVGERLFAMYKAEMGYSYGLWSAGIHIQRWLDGIGDSFQPSVEPVRAAFRAKH